MQTPEQPTPSSSFSASGDDEGLPRAYHEDGAAHVNSSLCLLRLPLIIVMDWEGKGESDGPCFLITYPTAASSSADVKAITPSL